MRKVTYSGPGEGVHLAPYLGGTWMPTGVPVEVPEEVADSLLDQDTFTGRRRRGAPPDQTTEARTDGSTEGAGPDPGDDTDSASGQGPGPQ